MPPTTLPNLGLSGETPHGEDDWDVADRANLRRLDTLVNLSVKQILATPPASPADGDRYIIGPAPSGAWAGHASKVAAWNAALSAWDTYTPKPGWRAYVEDVDNEYGFYATGGWQDRLSTAHNMAVRYYNFEAIAGLGPRTGGTTATVLPPRISAVGTGTPGANRIWAWSEFVHHEPYQNNYPTAGAGAWWSLTQEVRVVVELATTVTSPAGDSLQGVCIGSPKAAPPWDLTGLETAGLDVIQLRKNFVNSKLEVLLYAGGGGVRTVEECATQPTLASGVPYEWSLKWIGEQRKVVAAIDGTVVHTTTSAPLDIVGGSGPDQGIGIFLTSGSSASGTVSGAAFSNVRAITYSGRK